MEATIASLGSLYDDLAKSSADLKVSGDYSKILGYLLLHLIQTVEDSPTL